MSDRVDALFGGDLPEASGDREPRLRRIEQMLWFAIALNVLGIPCWTSVPGAVLTLWAWFATDPENVELNAAGMTPEERDWLQRLRRRANATLALCIAALILQIILLSTAFYSRLWGSFSVALQHLWQAG